MTSALSTSSFEIVTTHDIPEAAQHVFESYRNGGYDLPSVRLQHFDSLLAVNHDDRTRTFIASARVAKYNWCKEWVFAVDLTPDGRQIGDAVAQYQSAGGDWKSEGVPFVWWNSTTPDYRRQKERFGRRRLVTLNAATLMLHELPLHSAPENISDAAICTWESLARDGRAQKYRQATLLRPPRFRFIA